MLNIKKIKNIKTYSIFFMVILITSCSSMKVTEEAVYDSDISTVEASIIEEKEMNLQTKAVFTNATVYFEFDKFNLNSKSLQTLKSAVSAMKDNKSIRITIAGHADERGTREYNLALGEQRAKTVAELLIINGVPSSKISTVSYGEEKPAASGSNENSWSKNRRALVKTF